MAVGVALLALAGWWVLRAPLIEKPMAAVPEVDIDAPAMHAVRGVPGAARSASDESPGIASLASAAASGTTTQEASCFADDGPKYAEPEIRDGVMAADQTKGAGTGYIAAQARVEAALRASADPFDHAVADFLNVGDERTPAGRMEALVQPAATTNDPRIYSLALQACQAIELQVPWLKLPASAPPSCAALNARGWAALDPGNGVPWLMVLSRAGAAKDVSGQQDALAHLAAASRFDVHSLDVAAAVVNHAPSDDGHQDAVSGLVALGVGALSLASPTSVALADACRGHASGDEARARQCEAIMKTMYDNTNSPLLRSWAGTLTILYGGDTSRRKAALAESKIQMDRLRSEMPEAPCASHRFQMKLLVRSAQIGELAALRELAASAPAKQ